MSEANTFSIVARCPKTGQLGVAVATAVPAVGTLCPYVRSRIGAVSTQAWVNPYLAVTTLEALEKGIGADEALQIALADDDGRHYRQIGVVDASGRSAAYTGASCTPWCGQILGPGFAIAGNMLTGPEVLDAMAAAFNANMDADLIERLMLTLEAGEAAGGDKRGKQSAALRVHGEQFYPLLDIRVDEHTAPIVELRRMLPIARAQLIPFVQGMPKSRKVAEPAPRDVRDVLLRPPPDRPGGGGSRRS